MGQNWSLLTPRNQALPQSQALPWCQALPGMVREFIRLKPNKKCLVADENAKIRVHNFHCRTKKITRKSWKNITSEYLN